MVKEFKDNPMTLGRNEFNESLYTYEINLKQLYLVIIREFFSS